MPRRIPLTQSRLPRLLHPLPQGADQMASLPAAAHQPLRQQQPMLLDQLGLRLV